jgi:PqqD family protein of HPr-rel-A system
MRGDTRLRAAAADVLVRAQLDALTVVYDRRSGQTHLLAAPLPDLLDALGEREWTLADFAQNLAVHYDLASDGGDPQTLIAQHLAELAALGLVEAR